MSLRYTKHYRSFPGKFEWEGWLLYRSVVEQRRIRDSPWRQDLTYRIEYTDNDEKILACYIRNVSPSSLADSTSWKYTRPFSCCWAVADEYTPRSGECNRMELKKQSDKQNERTRRNVSRKSDWHASKYLYLVDPWISTEKQQKKPFIFIFSFHFFSFFFFFFVISNRIKYASHSNFRFLCSERSVRPY